MLERVAIGIVVLTPLAVSGAALAHDCYDPSDVNLDGAIDLLDHAVCVECLGGPGVTAPPVGCAAPNFAACDQDGDADVDIYDFAVLFATFGAVRFDYGPHRDEREAEMLAMKLSGSLRASHMDYERVRGDLARIRAEFPELLTVIADPEYVEDELIVNITTPEPGAHYLAINDFYRVVDEEVYTWGRVLTFCENLNAPVLAGEYASTPGVMWADPNWWIGHDDYIDITPAGTTYRYSIDDGFWDCFDGCDCHRLWEIDVDLSGVVTLISYEEVGWWWCEF